jgi:DNA repair photolyase
MPVEYVPAKTIVYHDKSPGWFGGDYKMNLYRGCNHGCIYCDSRSDCYQIENFDMVRAKQNALEIVRNDLRRKVKPGVVLTGSASDPYNRFEKELMLSQGALELINAYGFGVGIATKSDLITRDIDVLRDIASHSPFIVKLTITTADDALAKKIEPGAPSSSERFAAVEALSKSGVYAGIMMTPVLPWLTGTGDNIEKLVRRAKECGAKFIYSYMSMTIRSGQREHMYAAFDRHFPDLREKYTRQYGDAYSCPTPNAKALWARFTAACTKSGLLYDMTDIIRGYRSGYEGTQLTFFR